MEREENNGFIRRQMKLALARNKSYRKEVRIGVIMENLLFQSSGMPAKQKKFLQLCGILLIICGLILLVIAQIKESSWYGYSYYLFDEDGRTLLSLLGGLGCVFGVAGLLYIQFDSSNKAQLLMYDSCVMGVQPTPLQKFSLSYDEITNVEQVTVIKTDMLIIRTSITTYTVPTDNLQQAYQVLCQKVAEARAKSKAE